jgi:hypothetical protein
VIESTFDTDLDGWTKAPGADAASTTLWVATGGNPGGHLRHSEAADGLVDRIAAPAKFLGDLSDFLEGTLSFDRRTTIITNTSNRNDDVLLIGAGFTLRYNLPDPTVGVWVSHSILLEAGAGWIDTGTNAAPTPTVFSIVLADVEALQLLADFRSGSEGPTFDNIRLTVIPEPGHAVVIAGLVALLGCLWRRRA